MPTTTGKDKYVLINCASLLQQWSQEPIFPSLFSSQISCPGVHWKALDIRGIGYNTGVGTWAWKMSAEWRKEWVMAEMDAGSHTFTSPLAQGLLPLPQVDSIPLPGRDAWKRFHKDMNTRLNYRAWICEQALPPKFPKRVMSFKVPISLQSF